MKIYDCFYFFDELDLLEIRLNILNNFVDYFVLVEATETFNGKYKKLFYSDNQDRFFSWKHKIIHYVVDDYPNDIEIFNKALKSKNTGNKEHWWIREFYQKESLEKSLGCCGDEDIILVSDVDEIWNPDIKLTTFPPKMVYRPIQEARPFYLDNKSDQDFTDWTGTRFSGYKTFKKYGPNHFRTEREVVSVPINNGGWHFSWLGGKEDKWNDGHPDNAARFEKAHKARMFREDNQLPEYLRNNKKRWRHLFLPQS